MGQAFKYAVTCVFDPNTVLDNMEKFKNKAEAAFEILCMNGAQKMESYAKEHRPWKDRTGNARQRLKGSWKKVDKGYQIEIAHGVNYGVWLEVRHERRYAILKPTVEKVGYGEILPAFNNLIDKIKL